MATFIATIKFTEQGIKSIGETTKRAASFKSTAKKMGIKITGQFWTLGEFDGLLLFEAPNDETATAAMPPTIQAGVPLQVVDVEMEPPAGRERLFAVWTRRPLRLGLEQLQRLAVGEAAWASREYQATRNMVRMKESVQQLPAEDWHAVVLELDHRA